MLLIGRVGGTFSRVLRCSVKASSIGVSRRRSLPSIAEAIRSLCSVAAAAEDVYPSRRGTCEVQPRADPVVWTQNGTSAEGPLSAEQLRHYEERGFLIIENLFTADELKPLKDELKRVQTQMESNIADGDDPTITAENIFSTEPATTKLRSIFGPHLHFEQVRRMSRSEKLLSRVRQILADDLYVHQSRMNYHQALVGTGHSWHTDFEPFHSEDGMPRMRSVNCGLMLGPHTPQHGCLMVLPESHKVFIPTAASTPADNLSKSSKYKIVYGAPDEAVLGDLVSKHGIEYCPGQEGSIVLFDINLLHANQNNLSPSDRMTLFFSYNSVNNKLVKPFNAPWDRRPEHMGARASRWVEPLKPIANLAE